MSHGNLTVSIQTLNGVSQPAPFSNGTTTPVQNSVVSAKQGKASVIYLPRRATLAEVAQALDAIGATPADFGSDRAGAETCRCHHRRCESHLMTIQALSAAAGQQARPNTSGVIRKMEGLMWYNMLSEMNKSGLDSSTLGVGSDAYQSLFSVECRRK